MHVHSIHMNPNIHIHTHIYIHIHTNILIQKHVIAVEGQFHMICTFHSYMYWGGGYFILALYTAQVVL